MTEPKQKSVSLVKLMKVVVGIGIVAAVPVLVFDSYNDYLKKEKVSEAMVLLEGFSEIMGICPVAYPPKKLEWDGWPTFQQLKDKGVFYKGTYATGDYNDASAAAGIPQVCFKISGFEPGKDSIGWKYTSSATDSQKMWRCKATESGYTTIDNAYLPKYCKQ
ncbi:PilE/Pilin [Thioploca ingrica]|uniref:PilE/Pilin n=1 Tax=Thioploca ingrica TaxID=40754 RepID=A0A090AF89_9GAMM|nr:PilE/Pilin [Thioploca ingrica]